MIKGRDNFYKDNRGRGMMMIRRKSNDDDGGGGRTLIKMMKIRGKGKVNVLDQNI